MLFGSLLTFALPAAGAPEGADGKPREEQCENDVDDQMAVAEAGGFVEDPGVLGEEDSKESEEDADNLVAEDAGSMGKGTNQGGTEAAGSAGKAACSIGGGAEIHGRARAGGRRRGGTRSIRGGNGRRARRGGLRRGSSEAIGLLAQLLAGDTGGDAEDPTDAIGLHKEKSTRS